MVRSHLITAELNARRDKEIASLDQVHADGATLPDTILKALEAQDIKVTESERRKVIATSGWEKIEIQAGVKLQQVRLPPEGRRAAMALTDNGSVGAPAAQRDLMKHDVSANVSPSEKAVKITL